MALAFTCACLLLAPILLGALFCVLLVGVTLVTPLAFAALCVLSLAHITCHRRRKVRAHIAQAKDRLKAALGGLVKLLYFPFAEVPLVTLCAGHRCKLSPL